MGNVEYAECYAELANAIVLQAFKDYRKALFKLVQEPEEWKHRSSKKKLERFFHSKWYRTLTELDPEILMQEAKRQAGCGSHVIQNIGQKGGLDHERRNTSR